MTELDKRFNQLSQPEQTRLIPVTKTTKAPDTRGAFLMSTDGL
ncbi:hypothetical protein ACTL6P_12805 [Endozoicomonas acroporae]|nr:hypothetical protein [Endozoicomonas acroporae]